MQNRIGYIIKYVLIRFALVLFFVFLSTIIYESYPKTYLEKFGIPILQFLSFIFLIGIAFQLVISVYRRRMKIFLPKQDNIIVALNNIYRIVVIVVAFGTILSLFNISVVTVFTSLSIVAAAIAIVAKEEISSLLCGFIITFSKTISIGDFIEIKNYRGQVIHISLTKTHLLNENEEMIFLPNSEVQHCEIVNYTKGNNKKGFLNVKLPFKTSSFELEDLQKKLNKEFRDLKDDRMNISNIILSYYRIEGDNIIIRVEYNMENFRFRTQKYCNEITNNLIINYLNNREGMRGVLED